MIQYSQWIENNIRSTLLRAIGCLQLERLRLSAQLDSFPTGHPGIEWEMMWLNELLDATEDRLRTWEAGRFTRPHRLPPGFVRYDSGKIYW